MEGLVSPKWALSGRGTASAITISQMATARYECTTNRTYVERNRKIVARNPDHASVVVLWMPLGMTSRVREQAAIVKFAHIYVGRRGDRGVMVARTIARSWQERGVNVWWCPKDVAPCPKGPCVRISWSGR